MFGKRFEAETRVRGSKPTDRRPCEPTVGIRAAGQPRSRPRAQREESRGLTQPRLSDRRVAGFAVSHGAAYTLGHSLTLRVGAGFQSRSAPTYALRAPT